MRTLAWSTCARYAERNASAHTPLREWYRLCERADWASFADVRNTFGSADQVGDKLVFNIGGNSCRLIARVSYPYRDLRVKWIGTHAEYDRLTERQIREL